MHGDKIVVQSMPNILSGWWSCFVCKLGRLMWPTCLAKNSGLIKLNGQIYPGLAQHGPPAGTKWTFVKMLKFKTV